MKILITGATNGMGKGVAKVLAGIDNQAHEIIMLGRSKARCEAVTQELIHATSNQNISFVVCDLARLSDVRQAITEIQDKHAFLDGIFINAGLGYAAKRIETEDGMDAHFQVNYLSQFLLILNLLDLLEKSQDGGRVIFNVTKRGQIFWDDLQMQRKWGYERGIHQAMVAKRMFLARLHALHREKENSKLSFIGFQIPKTVWTNQINIIPGYMRTIASIAKFFGAFISIEKCGEIMAPLFIESQDESLQKSGKLITAKKNEFIDMEEAAAVLNPEWQAKLWELSLALCGDKGLVRN